MLETCKALSYFTIFTWVDVLYPHFVEKSWLSQINISDLVVLQYFWYVLFIYFYFVLQDIMPD